MLTGAIVLASALTCAPADRARIAEVLYDAAGDDTGLEFVELYNPTDRPCALAGARLVAGDGAGPGRWTARWTGSAAAVVPAHGRFVIGGARMVPVPDAVAALDLQNGPDAVRLEWPDGVVEVVGWGEHEFAEYACGAAAVDAPSGFSIARVPDDADLGGNALDFRAAPPSPGAPNQPSRDAGWAPGRLVLVPEQPDPFARARLAGVVVNAGAQSLPVGSVGIEVVDRVDGAESIAGGGTIQRVLEAGDSAAVAVDIDFGAAGRHTLSARLAVTGDERAANDVDSVRARVGPGPLRISEIQFHPAQDEGEWVEVESRDGAPLDLSTFTLSDRGTTRAHIAADRPPLQPGRLAVVAQDRAALLRQNPGLDSLGVWQASPWPALNNTNDATGLADAVVVRESDGMRCDRHDYSATGVPAGVPIERAPDGEWRVAYEPSGSPLRPPREPPAVSGHLALAASRVAAGTPTLRYAWSLPWPRARVAVEIYDLSGRRVERWASDLDVSARGERDGTIASLPPGLYVVALHAREPHGGDLVATRPLRVDGAAR